MAHNGEVYDGVAPHSLTPPKYLKEVINPNIADGAARAGRDPKDVNLNNSSFIVTGINQAAIDKNKKSVKTRSRSTAPRRTIPRS